MNHRADIADNAHPKKKEAAEPTAQTETSSLTHLTAPAASSPPPHPNPPPTHIPTLPLPAAAPLSEMGGGGGVVLGTPHRPPPHPQCLAATPLPATPPTGRGLGGEGGICQSVSAFANRTTHKFGFPATATRRPRHVRHQPHPHRPPPTTRGAPRKTGSTRPPPLGPMEDGGFEPKCV